MPSIQFLPVAAKTSERINADAVSVNLPGGGATFVVIPATTRLHLHHVPTGRDFKDLGRPLT